MLLVELQNKNNELERFTYTVSHDLKAQSITIDGFVGYLARDLTNENPVNVIRDVERIMNAVQKNKGCWMNCLNYHGSEGWLTKRKV